MQGSRAECVKRLGEKVGGRLCSWLSPLLPLLTGKLWQAVTQNGQLVGILKKKDILEHIELYRKGLSDRRQDTL